MAHGHGLSRGLNGVAPRQVRHYAKPLRPLRKAREGGLHQWLASSGASSQWQVACITIKPCIGCIGLYRSKRKKML